MKTFVCIIIILTSFSHAQRTSRSEIIARNGMAATSHPLATQIAVDILKKGGSAVDAAIAANAALGLIEPMSCGIGGDLFALVWDSQTNKLYGLNASGRSPASLELDYFRRHNLEKIPLRGGLSVSVPGCVDGWFELHHKFGRLPMKEILAPVIDYAQEGVATPEIIAGYWAGGVRSFADVPNFIKTYTINGKSPLKGQLFNNPDLARTYQQIADHGRDAFYQGKMAEKISQCVRNQGGFLSTDDLARHQSEWVEPLSVRYRGYDVWELPPNGQGIAVLQILQILEKFDLASLRFGSARHIHCLIEAFKLVFEDRAVYYADPESNDVPVQKLLSPEYADARARLINLQQANLNVQAGKLSDSETVYLCTADKDGNMVSLIQSNYYNFGSGLVPDSLGFALQNRGALFSLNEGSANVYAPRKRPFHTIIPGFVTQNNEPYLCFGVMGGDFQPQGQVQILVNLIDFGMNLQQAGDAPRCAHEGSSSPRGEEMIPSGGLVGLEKGFPSSLAEELRSLGHTVKVGDNVMFFGGYQAIKYDRENGVLIGASEVRKDGQAAGY